ncbi:hypothetical protein BDP55DRAFT_643161 [Colletotrichum godetiae]|uniref:Uncharacterized protein n=1 Tax=Colletotrichum godetiae TaxID=1209918 RepID=A0AAJ0AY72_9PEZI|nr:uncharacterized protein BDP55DRAFT_643161 [Colletotrichum godetiae]KAK1700494.1 hypothetical protein BDP55DRAFT_643161 [Colletotrichum godetiae]
MQGASATRPMTAMRKDWLRFAPNPSSPLSRIQTSRPTSPLSISQCSHLQIDCQTLSYLSIPTYLQYESITHSLIHSRAEHSFRSPTPTRRTGATPPLPILLSTEQTTRRGGPSRSIWYLLQEPVPNYFQLPRFVLPTVLAPSQDFVRPTKDHRHTLSLCFPMPTTLCDWLGEWRGWRVTLTALTFFTLSVNWPGPEVRGTSLETDVRRLVQGRLLAEHCRWRPWPSFCLATCFFILMLCPDLFFFCL